MAVLRTGGIDDAISEQLIMDVMIGTSSLANSLMIKVGTISREHDFAGDSLISLRISSSVASSKFNKCFSGGKVVSVHVAVSWPPWLANSLWIRLILSMKNLQKASGNSEMGMFDGWMSFLVLPKSSSIHRNKAFWLCEDDAMEFWMLFFLEILMVFVTLFLASICLKSYSVM